MSRSVASSRLRIRCRRHAVASTVAVRAWLLGGSLDEAVPGEALITGRLLPEGTAHHSWDQIAARAEDRGIDLAGVGGLEVTGVAVDALARDWRRALELAAELVLEASFPPDRLEQVRRQTSSELDSLSERPEVVAGWAFLEQLYGEDHPAGRPLQGSTATLAALGRADCFAFHRRSLDNGILVSVAGDLDVDEARRAIDGLFSAVPPARRSPSRPSPPGEVVRSHREVSVLAGDQAHLYVGQLTVAADHPDVPALQLAAVVLGSGPGLVGRIPARIRERDGLAYGASATTIGGAGRLPGRLVVHVATAPRRVEAALEAVREELRRFVIDGISQRELEEARTYLLGSEPFRRESARQVAVLGARSMLYGVGWDEPGWLERALAPLDRAAVNEAIGRHLHPDRLAVTVGLPSSRGESPGAS